METITRNLRAKATIEKMVANGGKATSWAQAMRDAGYSESYARNPQKIKNTKVWRDYLEHFFSNDRLVTTHRNLLEATKVSTIDFPLEITDKGIKRILTSSNYKIINIKREKTKAKVTLTEPDFSIRTHAINMAYRIKGIH